MSTANSKVGPITASDAADATLRAGRSGELITGHLHGRYFESAFRGSLFNVATAAHLTTTVGLATTYTGLVLSNPINSTVNLSIIRASFMQDILQATQVEAYGLAVGFNSGTNVTHTTPVAPKSNKVGSGITATALADVSATLPTAPLYHTFVTSTPSATTNAGGQSIYLDGSILLIPGAYVLWVTPTQASVASSLWFGFDWEEVSV